MAAGDIAAAAGIRLTPGSVLANTIDTEINLALDAIVTEDNKVKARTVPIANGGTGATSASAARTNLGAASTSHTHTQYAATSHTHSQYATKNALGHPLAVADITTSPSHALGMFYRADIARPVIRVDATDFPVATWPSADPLVAVIAALEARIEALEARP